MLRSNEIIKVDNAIILSHFDYLKKLQKLQNRAVRVITVSSCETSSEEILSE